VPEVRLPTATTRGRAGHRPAPTDAPSAYVALLHELEERPAARRAPGESPAEHARRLREAGTGESGLDRLAADYALVRFAGRAITSKEERRALARWARLRRTLGVMPRGRGRAS
jgi:hypothetical protein